MKTTYMYSIVSDDAACNACTYKGITSKYTVRIVTCDKVLVHIFTVCLMYSLWDQTLAVYIISIS
jgi:uncharacterized membrane protein